MMSELDLSNLERALREAGLKVRLDRVIGEGGFGMYRDVRVETRRGGQYHVILQSALDGGHERIKSIVRIIDKNKSYYLLMNGQASRNTKDVKWFYDGEGPLVGIGRDHVY